MALDQAREYLARVLAWPQPGEAGFVNIHWTFPSRRTPGKADWTGRAVVSLKDAVSNLEWAMRIADTKDIYACLSLQSSCNPRISGKGNKYNSPIRLAQNAMYLKAFWLDIDIKAAPKGYADEVELITELKAFITKINLPPPTLIVHSGGGMHAYWIVNERLTVEEWQPYAFALSDATKQFGLRCDTQCTVDAARVLRIPETLNRKLDQARPVRLIGKPLDFDYSFSRIKIALDPYVGMTKGVTSTGIDPLLFPRRAIIHQSSELQAGLENLYPLPDLDIVRKSCKFIDNTLATGGVDNDNALWNLTTLIATHSKGGRGDAHRMGHAHITYTLESTDEFFDRKEHEKQTRGLGWPSCQAISAAGAKECSSCPLFPHGKSPLNFEILPTVTPQVTAFIPAASTVNDMPPGYARTPAGTIGRLMPDPNNPTGGFITSQITDYPMYDAWLQAEPRILHFMTVVDRGKPGQISIDTEVVNTNEMRKVLQAQGFMLAAGDKAMGEFLMSWIRHLQTVKDSVNTAPFGWYYDGEKPEGFIFADRLWSPKGDTPSANGSKKMQIRYRPKGTTQTWLDAAKLVSNLGRPDLEVLVASSFAAPLVTFTGHNGLLLSAFSRESGIGKTTAVKIAQAVWGDPLKGVQGLTDTENAVIGICAELKSLPLFWDELKTDEDTKKFVKMTFQITSGKGKSRMDSRAQLKEPGEWQTLVVSASNESLIEHVTAHTPTTAAGMMRIFEYRVKPIKTAGSSTTAAQIAIARLNNSYGTVGLEYAKWLGANHVAIAADVEAFSEALEKETSSTQEERNWIALIAIVLLGARFANGLGLNVFNEPAMKEFLLGELANMRANRAVHTVDLDKAVNVSAVLNAFFNDVKSSNGWLVTDRIHVGAGKPPKGSVKVVYPADSRMGGVTVQVSAPGGNDLMRISGHALGAWCKKTSVNRYNLLEALAKIVTYRQVIGKLGGGTQLSGSTEQLYELDLTTSKDLDFVNE
jgi:hypothetical protein